MARPDRLVRRALRTRYLITTTSEETFDGVLVDADDRHLVLADTDAIARNNDRTRVDGHLWVPRSTVKYMQQALTQQ